MGTTKRVVFSSSLLKECKDMVASSVIDLLESIAEKSDNPKVTITSTWRNPYRQAMAMYNNLVAGKRIRYREPGRKVTALFDDCQDQGMDKEETIDEMSKLISRLSEKGERVSKHCVSAEEYRKVNVLDVSMTMEKPVEFLAAALDEPRVVKVISPISIPGKNPKFSYDLSEPAFHLEIIYICQDKRSNCIVMSSACVLFFVAGIIMLVFGIAGRGIDPPNKNRRR